MKIEILISHNFHIQSTLKVFIFPCKNIKATVGWRLTGRMNQTWPDSMLTSGPYHSSKRNQLTKQKVRFPWPGFQ